MTNDERLRFALMTNEEMTAIAAISSHFVICHGRCGMRPVIGHARDACITRCGS
jgi:hypothetical protein